MDQRNLSCNQKVMGLIPYNGGESIKSRVKLSLTRLCLGTDLVFCSIPEKCKHKSKTARSILPVRLNLSLQSLDSLWEETDALSLSVSLVFAVIS